mgnify:FL=1
MKIQKLCCPILVCLILFGCKAPPNAIETKTIDTPLSNEESVEVPVSEPEKDPIEMIREYNGLQVTGEFQSAEGRTLRIDGTVQVNDTNKVGIYRYIPSTITDDMRQKIFNIYFGDRAKDVVCVDDNQDIWQLGETMSGDFYIYQTNFTMDSSGDIVFNLSYRRPNLNYLDENLLSSIDDSKCSISLEDAKTECGDFLAALCEEETYEADVILAYGKEGALPFYKITCRRVLDGLPVISYNDFYFFVDDNGIERIRGGIYKFEETEKAKEYTQVLSPEDAMKCLADYIEGINFYKSDILEIHNIRLEYAVEQQNGGEAYIIPVWRFEIGMDENEAVMNRYKILAVNIFTGSIIQEKRG